MVNISLVQSYSNGTTSYMAASIMAAMVILESDFILIVCHIKRNFCVEHQVIIMVDSDLFKW